MRLESITLYFIIVFASTLSWARPEYAAQNTYVSCTMCHESPFGGGIRKTQGKIFGSHGYWPSEFSKNEWLQVDYRAEAAYAKGPASTRKGLVLMNTTPAVYLPITSSPEEKSALVVSYGLGLLDNGLRDSYVLFSFGEGPQGKALNHLMIGRFLPAFGLATDEHRTYTRLATKTTIMDHEAGFGLSGDPSPRLHYDFAATSGLQSGGSSLATNDSPWAIYANVRWNPLHQPFFLGASYTTAGTQNVSYPLEATSVFGALGTEQLSNGSIRGSIAAEVVSAHGWNNTTLNSNMNMYFFPQAETAWADAAKDSRSLAGSLQFNYELSPKWTLLYKQEQFIPDVQWSGDVFYSYGYGFKHYLNSNMDINARYEKKFSTRPGVTEAGAVRGAVDIIYVLFHLWI